MIKVWDINSGKEISSVVGDKDAVNCVTFTPDGNSLISGTWNNTIKIWQVIMGKEKPGF